jgi:hypothetical protein
MKDEFFLFERLTQSGFQTELAWRRVGHSGSVKQISIAPRFGFLERGFGVRE